MAPKKDKQEQNREGPQQPALDMQAPVGDPDETKGLRQSVAALRDALQREKQRADAATRELDEAIAKMNAEMESIRAQLGSEVDANRNLDRRRMLAERERDDLLETARGVASVIGFAGPGKDLPNAVLERLTAPQAPVTGWASERAKELALAVPEPDRLLLLGDLLAMLALFVGETGKNETATDTLQRKVTEAAMLSNTLDGVRNQYEVLCTHLNAAQREVSDLKAAMVARRAPDATAEAEFSRVREALRGPALVFGLSGNVDWAAVAEQLAKEWRGLRTFFSEKPMVALAVKDESTPALADRYTLLLLQWDGKKLAPSTLEERMPWGDISPLLRQALASRLTPPQFRG